MPGPHLAPSIHNSSPSNAVEGNFPRHSRPWSDVSTLVAMQTTHQQQVHLTTTSIHNTTSIVMTTTTMTRRSFGGQEGLRSSLETSRTVSATAVLMFALLSSTKHPADEVTNKLAGVPSIPITVKPFQTPFASGKLESISQSKSISNHPILREQTTSTRHDTQHVTTSIPHLENSLLPSKEIQQSMDRMTEHGAKTATKMKTEMKMTMTSTELNPTAPIREDEVDSHDLNESLNFGLIFGNFSSSTLYELEQANFDNSERLNESIAALKFEGVETTQEDRNDFDLNFFKSIIAAGSSDGFVEGELQDNFYNDTFLSGYEDLGQNQMAANDNNSSNDYNETLREQTNSTHKPQVYVLVGVSVATVVLCLLAVFGLVIICRRHVILSKYNSLPSTSHSYFAYDYIYRPLHGNRLDDEYENTFVGVSIPLLQEVTVIWSFSSSYSPSSSSVFQPKRTPFESFIAWMLTSLSLVERWRQSSFREQAISAFSRASSLCSKTIN